ncbi:hypothetical protein HYD59_00985 [Mycoplasmopsis bovis]|nr:hypothetical protein [Mycoplasmopsis bovis]QQH60946.1 hypothetical protein HYD59_00985 [Mycoplasmopsis bovis]
MYDKNESWKIGIVFFFIKETKKATYLLLVFYSLGFGIDWNNLLLDFFYDFFLSYTLLFFLFAFFVCGFFFLFFSFVKLIGFFVFLVCGVVGGCLGFFVCGAFVLLSFCICFFGWLFG